MRDIEISFVEKAGPKAKDPDAIVSLGGVYAGRPWSMRPEALAMAIDRGLYAFHAVIFEEVLPVVLVRNAAGKIAGLGTPKDIGPLKLLLTLPGPEALPRGPERTVTVTSTRSLGENTKKQTVRKTVKK